MMDWKIYAVAMVFHVLILIHIAHESQKKD